MEFRLHIEHANALYAHAKGIIGNHPASEGLRMLQCNIDGNVLTALALNKACCAEFKCEVTDCDGKGPFRLSPPSKKFTTKGDGDYITVKCEESETTYTTKQGTLVIENPEPPASRFDPKRIMEEVTKETWLMDPGLLDSVLSIYKKEKVPIEIGFISDTKGIYISREGSKALVLPCKKK